MTKGSGKKSNGTSHCRRRGNPPVQKQSAYEFSSQMYFSFHILDQRFNLSIFQTTNIKVFNKIYEVKHIDQIKCIECKYEDFKEFLRIILLKDILYFVFFVTFKKALFPHFGALMFLKIEISQLHLSCIKVKLVGKKLRLMPELKH